ncbi:ABC transporter substrate-binding protein [Xanthobacter sp. TB0139]|uniref:ABC transporter substrate-binding protein n=1 Tax=Xanthobacter sp. TB0139 TaxID=3459178 RepID=UPI004038FEDF
MSRKSAFGLMFQAARLWLVMLMAVSAPGAFSPVLAQQVMAQHAPAPSPKPSRIVSLNLCADELLLRLVPKARILSVTTLASDTVSSSVADLAQGVPTNRGLAEEVIPLGPDLVLAGAFTTRATVSNLRRFGVDVMDLAPPQSLDEAYTQIRAVAARLGEPEKGEEMVRELQASIPSSAPRQTKMRPLRAVVVRPNGFTAGRQTLADDLLRRAGLDNVAARLKPDKLGQLSLEEIVTARPEVVILDTDPDAPASIAGMIMHHPALTHAVTEARVVNLPTRLWACAGPQLAEAYARLSGAAQAGPSPSASADDPPSHHAAHMPQSATSGAEEAMR